MERNTFEFDGGMVRYTLAGAVLASIARLLFWGIVIGFTLAVLILLGFEIAAYMVGFHPVWRL